MTVRSIRNYQSRGLVPPPRLTGRTGYYGEDHVKRIKLIRELQGEGFNLTTIRRFVEDRGGKTQEVLALTRAARAPFEDEQSREVSAEELAERWGEKGDPELLRRAIKLGLVRELEGGRFEERSPRLGKAGLELARLGIAPHVTRGVVERARESLSEVAEAYVELFLNEVWRPFEAEGRPDERLPEVRAALERLRPVASEALLGIFGLVMTEATERALGREIEKIDSEVAVTDAAWAASQSINQLACRSGPGDCASLHASVV